LISPLMGPINGIGYSIATYNFNLLRRSIKNFTFAVLAGLVASTTYFLISPVSTAHSELLARTSPTIYDVLIALFGGLAGIVAISSKQKGNVIPGVAIATALMPPLCTAGYGLATAQLTFFFGAFYLFTINTVFIAISSILFSQILKFPYRDIVDTKKILRTNRIVWTIIIITFAPSIYFGYLMVQKEKFNTHANVFIKNVSVFEGNYLLKPEINSERRSIALIYAGNTLNENDKNRIKEIAHSINLDSSKIHIEQWISFSEERNKTIEKEQLIAQINKYKELLDEKNQQIDSIRNMPNMGQQLLAEIQVLFPEVQSCTYAASKKFDLDNFSGSRTYVVALGYRNNLTETEKQKLITWMETRLNTKQLLVNFFHDD
jgi:uncharacterized hydrophobic protein (TIGR00271 family)